MRRGCDITEANVAIEMSHVKKQFVIKKTNRAGGTVNDRTHIAINDISLKINKGEVLGIVGQNGSGKSTLLKLLTGIMVPDEGKIHTSGSVASILELGSGFDVNFTGRENIYLKCSQYGFSDKQIDEFIEEIIEFSGLGDVIDDPLRTYSSGMSAKLALPTIMHLRRDIMVFDEILSVGDAGLGAKCNQIFNNLKREGKTIIVASHNLRSLEKMCDRVLWIDCGRVVEIGKPVEVCSKYETSLIESIELVERGALSGDTFLQNRLGEMYLYGINTEIDVEKAEHWFRKSSDLGYVPAILNLANIEKQKGNYSESKTLYNYAYESGNNEAYLLMKSLEENKDTKNPVPELKTLSERGNVRAMILYAECLNKGICTSQDIPGSYEWYKKAADYGEPSACFFTGKMLRDGQGVEKNIPLAVSYLEKSAKNGFGYACIELANMYRNGQGVEQDIQKCIYWFEYAAMRGDSNAMAQLGNIYKNGLGVEKDLTKSKMWMDLWADQPRLIKEYQLADILKKRQEFIHSQMDGMYWEEDAADGGHIPSMLDAAITYRDGRGVMADIDKSTHYFTEAAKRGNNVAIAELASMYLKGHIVSKDDKKGYELQKEAAGYYHPVHISTLAKLYLDGIGVEQNLEEAIRLFKIAAEYGDSYSIIALGLISKEKTVE